MKAQAWSRSPKPATEPATCRRCGGVTHLIAGDGPAVCRVCLFAWVQYAAVIGRGPVVHEIGGAQLRHASHDVPVRECRLCRAAQLSAAPHFDAWLRGRGT
jgi:hypothetical protein